MIITDEMKKEEINRKDMLPISFLELSPYTGSKRGIRFRLEKNKSDKGSAGKAVLRCYVWYGKLAFSNTPSGEIIYKDLEFSDAGIDEAIRFLNNMALKRVAKNKEAI